MIDNQSVLWKPFRLSPNYAISNTGRVWSHITGRELKPYLSSGGYPAFTFAKKHYVIHRLVAAAFIREPMEGEVCNHKDFNKTNNHVDNLEWVTPLQNTRHFLEGRPEVREAHIRKCRKLTPSQAAYVRASFNEGTPYRVLAQDFQVNRDTILKIVQGRTYKAGFSSSDRRTAASRYKSADQFNDTGPHVFSDQEPH